MSSQVCLSALTQELDTLTDEERAALRASRFHSAPKAPAERHSRLAHPGGALATNKAAALAKFLKRKLEQDGAVSLDPALVERAVENAKATICPGASSITTARVRHVDSFSDSEAEEAFKKLWKRSDKVQCRTVTNRDKRKKGQKSTNVGKFTNLNVNKTKKKKGKKSQHMKAKPYLGT